MATTMMTLLKDTLTAVADHAPSMVESLQRTLVACGVSEETVGLAPAADRPPLASMEDGDAVVIYVQDGAISEAFGLDDPTEDEEETIDEEAAERDASAV